MKRIRHYFSTILFLMIACNSFAGSPTSLTSIVLLPDPVQDVCAGTDISVHFLTDADANAGNIFTVQLSDATGSFANPVVIGSIASTTSSSFFVSIPLSTVPGTGYHIRVVSSSPVVTSNNGPELSVYALPTVTIAGNGSGAGGPGGFCAGGSITLSSNVGGAVTSYQWKVAGVNINGATGSTYIASVGGNYSLVVTNAAGCSNESNEFTVTQGSSPQGQVTSSGGNFLCPGGSMTLNANTITGTWYLNGSPLIDVFSIQITVTVPGDYQWLPHTIVGCPGIISPVLTITSLNPSFTGLSNNYSLNAPVVTLTGNPVGGTFSGPGISGDTFTPATAGVGGPYTITYSYTVPSTANNPFGCTVSSTQQTNITLPCTPPVAQITAAGSTTFCDGGSVQLIANTGTGLTYQWQVNSAPISGATASNYIASASGTYSVVVSNADGCSTQSNIIQVTENVAIQGSITGGGSGIICPSNPPLLSGNTSDGYWLLNGVQLSGTFSNGLLATAPGNYQWVPISLITGCPGIPSPVVSLSLLTASFSGLASGYTSTAAPVTLVGSPAGGTFSGPGISGNVFDPAVAGVGGPYNILYVYMINAACIASSTQQTTVTGGCTPPDAIITATGPTTFCQDNLTIVTLNANTGIGFTYQWQVDGVNLIGASQPAFVAGTSGNYTVVITNADGCSATSAPVTVTVIPLPAAQITAAGPTTFCGNGSVILNANSGAGLSYQWKIGTVNITGATTSSFVANISGNYTVVVTNNSGCSATSPAVAVTSNALPPVSFSGLANIYPAGAPAATLTGDPAGGTFSGPGISGNTFDPSIAGVGGPYNITYTYTNGNGCTNTATHQTTVGSVCPVPSIPGSISATSDGTSVCPGDIRTYTIPLVPGATSYTWTAPVGADIISGQGTQIVIVAYNAGFTAGDSIRVTADNSCGSSIARARKINRKAAPSSPIAISGPTTGICNATGILYSVIQEGANTYNWSWNTGGVSIVGGQGTNQVTSDFTTSFISGKISVTASNTCGTSTPRNLVVDAKAGTPGPITGLAGVCANQQGVAYSISPVTSATSYIWYAPTAAHINDGTTTSTGTTLATTATNVQVNFAATGGLVRVKAANACTVGAVVSLPVSIVCKNGLPATEIATEQPGNIFPNPSNGHFRIMLPVVSKIASAAKIEITNQFGQMVYQSNQPCSNRMIDLNLTGKFANGIYMVSYIVEGEKMVSKLMISQ